MWRLITHRESNDVEGDLEPVVEGDLLDSFMEELRELNNWITTRYQAQGKAPHWHSHPLVQCLVLSPSIVSSLKAGLPWFFVACCLRLSFYHDKSPVLSPYLVSSPKAGLPWFFCSSMLSQTLCTMLYGLSDLLPVTWNVTIFVYLLSDIDIKSSALISPNSRDMTVHIKMTMFCRKASEDRCNHHGS